MALTEVTSGATFNSTTNVTLAAGETGMRKVVKSVIVCNKDTVNHTIILEIVIGGTAYMLFKIQLSPNDTLVQDIPIVLTGTTQTLRTRMGEAVTTTQPTAVTTLAEIV